MQERVGLDLDRSSHRRAREIAISRTLRERRAAPGTATVRNAVKSCSPISACAATASRRCRAARVPMRRGAHRAPARIGRFRIGSDSAAHARCSARGNPRRRGAPRAPRRSRQLRVRAERPAAVGARRTRCRNARPGSARARRHRCGLRRSLRPRCAATNDSADSTAPCTLSPCESRCQPKKSVPSYSMPSAMRNAGSASA